MVKKSGSRKKRRSGPGFSHGAVRIAASFQQVPKAPAACVGVLIFLLASWLIVNAIVGSASTMDEFSVDPEYYRCTGRPSWLDPSSEMGIELSQRIREVLNRIPCQSIFDEGLLERLRMAIVRSCPMVADVRAADKVFPSQVRLELVLRRPKAVFLRNGRHWFIDCRGVVLFSHPVGDQAENRFTGLPFIVGADLTTTPLAGCVYPDRAMAEGAAVAEEIGVIRSIGKSPNIMVTAINVSGYGRNQADDAVLETRGGTRLLWGRSASGSRFSGNDPTPEQKARNLRKIIEIRPGLAGVTQVTLSFHSPSYVREGMGVTKY